MTAQPAQQQAGASHESTGRLAITLWDFSWYTQAGPGEPFADLDRAFAEAVDRGFNTVRVCAMPFLLFSGRVRDADSIRVRGLGDLVADGEVLGRLPEVPPGTESGEVGGRDLG
ncbi:cellulase-like family protein, partial [Streptomyces asoensis]|uniref:cellulase-like family protein n=1 Tax=Streptomyces asoensis TaxID=249586 RepID=UPI0033F4FB72